MQGRVLPIFQAGVALGTIGITYFAASTSKRSHTNIQHEPVTKQEGQDWPVILSEQDESKWGVTGNLRGKEASALLTMTERFCDANLATILIPSEERETLYLRFLRARQFSKFIRLCGSIPNRRRP